MACFTPYNLLSTICYFPGDLLSLLGDSKIEQSMLPWGWGLQLGAALVQVHVHNTLGNSPHSDLDAPSMSAERYTGAQYKRTKHSQDVICEPDIEGQGRTEQQRQQDISFILACYMCPSRAMAAKQLARGQRVRQWETTRPSAIFANAKSIAASTFAEDTSPLSAA